MTKLATEVDFKLSNGKTIPGLGLGTVGGDDYSAVKDQVKTAIKAGYRHIDTARFYGTEPYVGEAIKESIEEGIVKREDLFVTTKVWPSFHKNPEESFKQSIKELQLDYVDLLLQHWPACFKNEDGTGQPFVPKDENGKVIFDDGTEDGSGFIDFYLRLEKLYLDNQDKIKSLGVSNYSIPSLERLLPKIKVVPVVNQIEYHPQLPQHDLVDYCSSQGIHISAYSPVGSSGAPVLKVPLIKELADKYKVSTNEIANAYHILQGRSTLPRSSNLARIKSTIKLPPLTTSELDQLYQVGVKNPTRYVKDPWGVDLGFNHW